MEADCHDAASWVEPTYKEPASPENYRRLHFYLFKCYPAWGRPFPTEALGLSITPILRLRCLWNLRAWYGHCAQTTAREKVQTKAVTQKTRVGLIGSGSDLLPCLPSNPLYLPQSVLAQPLRTGGLSLPWNVGSFSLGVISAGVSNSRQLSLRFFCGLCDRRLCVPWHELRKISFIFPVLLAPVFADTILTSNYVIWNETDPGLFSAISGQSVEYSETVSQITKTKI